MNCPSCNHENEEGAKFCGGCGGDLEAFASEYDRPEAIVQYRELLTDFLGDLELEDWEEEELERTRGELKVTVAAHDALVEEMGGTADTPIPIAILLDTSQVEKFHVGGSCVFSFQFENQSERAVRSISLTFKDSELPESKTVKTKPIGPGRSSQEQKVEVLGQSGAHELTGDVTVVKTSGDPEQFELEPVTYDVGRDSDTPTQITMDMSSLRVADLSGVQMGATGAESGVVSDRTWYPLKLIRVSTAIRAEQIAEEQQKQKAVEEAEEERKRQETEAIEKARLDVDEAAKEKKRQELAQKQEEREAERREQAQDAELEIKLKQDRQIAEAEELVAANKRKDAEYAAEQQRTGKGKLYAVYQHPSKGFSAVRQGFSWWLIIITVGYGAVVPVSRVIRRGILMALGYKFLKTVVAKNEAEAIVFGKALKD